MKNKTDTSFHYYSVRYSDSQEFICVQTFSEAAVRSVAQII